MDWLDIVLSLCFLGFGFYIGYGLGYITGRNKG